MSDTYDSVKGQEKSNSNYERAYLIHRYEIEMSDRRKKQLLKNGIFEKYLITVNCVIEETFNIEEGAIRNRIIKIENLLEN
jgi:hypothetical protein